MTRLLAVCSVLVGFIVVLHASRSAAQTVVPEGTQSSSPESEAPPDEQMDEVLAVYKLIAGTPIIELRPTTGRQQFSAQDAAKILARGAGKAPAAEHILKVTDGMTVPGPKGPLPVRIYTPANSTPLPVVVYFHGGGFVLATIDTYDSSARALADASQAIVVSVEYRKAPEAKFPAALDDAIAAYRWIVANAASIGGDPSRVAVAGESAGGNLATEICLAARDSGFAMPVYEVLIYPVVDFSTDYPSDSIYANAVPLGTPALRYFGAQYLPNPADAARPDVSPIRAELGGLPGTTIIGAQIDPLQDQGRAYASKLKAAGVSVDYQLYEGVTHEFFGMRPVLDKARGAEALAGADLARAFSHRTSIAPL